MPSFFVDPLLCTTPAETATPKELGSWLLALEGWLNARDSSPFSWKNAVQCTEKIWELGRFPGFDAVRRIKAESGVDVNISRLLQRLNFFFQNESHYLHLAIPTQVALPETTPTIVPVEFIDRNVADVRPLLAETLVCLALDKSRNDVFARETRIVTRPFLTGDASISVRADDVEVDPPNTHESRIENSFVAVFTPQDLVEFRYESLVQGGEPSFVNIVREVVDEVFPGGTSMVYSVGAHFWRSLADTAMIQDRFVVEKAFKICAAIAAGRHDEMAIDRRKIRESAAGDSPQVTRSSDNAKAWRVSITKHGAGYRLHYWAIPALGNAPSRIEFANVAREQDRPVVIPDE